MTLLNFYNLKVEYKTLIFIRFKEITIEWLSIIFIFVLDYILISVNDFAIPLNYLK